MNTISTSKPINHLDDVLAAQRAAFLRDGPPTLGRRRADLKKLRSAILARRNEIEAALNADFGHRSRHETAIMDVMSVVLGIDYLNRNLRPSCARCAGMSRWLSGSGARGSNISRSASSESWRRGTIRSLSL
jgi:acyl-CoA reductase-like NAD-dependent aldehyde dehydrogenase